MSWSEFITQNTDDLSQYGLDNPIVMTIDYQVTETKSSDDAEKDSADTDSDNETGDDGANTDSNSDSENNSDTEEK